MQTATPLTTQERSLIESIYNELEARPGFRVRESQKALSYEIAETLASGAKGLTEAPTGTGKSIGYLIGSCVIAITRDRRVIVSTASTSLQDQLIGKDIPTVRSAFEALGIPIETAVLKGRDRYVCPWRLDGLTKQGQIFDDSPERRALLGLLDARKSGWDGCRDSLPNQLPPRVWPIISNDRHVCTGKQCPKYDACPYYQSVEHAVRARLVITNHDYLLSSLSNAGKGVMADFARNVFVFDEGHHLPEKVISAFHAQITVDAGVARAAAQVLQDCKDPAKESADMVAERIHGLCRALNQAASNATYDGCTQHIFQGGALPAGFARLAQQWRDSLDDMHETLRPVGDKYAAARSASSAGLAAHIRQRLGAVAESIAALDAVLAQNTDRALWMEFGSSQWALCTSPFRASSLAREKLWEKMRGVAITSATLTSLGDFKHVSHGLGLPEDTRTMRLRGVFDYEKNAEILIPKQFPEPSDPGYVPRLGDMLRKSAIRSKNKGVIVYFTARKTMEEVWRTLTCDEQSVVIMQRPGQSLRVVLDEHRARITSGKKSVIFGLDSLSEGVDLPGEFCTRVIITRLPFQHIEDPVLKAHSQALTAEGKSAFALLSLPHAGLKFAQLCGRLLRTEDDHGDILIPDIRLIRKNYGAQLLRSVPIPHRVV